MSLVASLKPSLLPLAAALSVLVAAPLARAHDAEDDCRSFFVPAEQYYALPTGLLAAMAMVESGKDGVPYPWALNIAGQAVMAPNEAAAAGLLRERDGSIRRDIAIGCLQIHMTYHLAPFGAPEWALRPRYNVWYAALFLRRLGGQYGNWTLAIAHYHASDPNAQRRYLCQVARQLERRAPYTRRALDLKLCGNSVPVHENPVMAARRRAGLQLLGGGS